MERRKWHFLKGTKLNDNMQIGTACKSYWPVTDISSESEIVIIRTVKKIWTHKILIGKSHRKAAMLTEVSKSARPR